MNLEDSLNVTSSKEKVDVLVAYIGSDKEKFDDLMTLLFTGQVRISKKAAWVMGHSIQKFPFLIKPYIGKLLVLLQSDLQATVFRNIVRTLQLADIPSEQLGQAFDIFYQLLQKHETAIVVKIFSMTILYNICVKEPELKNELIDLIQTQLENGSTGVKNRAKKTLQLLSKL